MMHSLLTYGYMFCLNTGRNLCASLFKTGFSQKVSGEIKSYNLDISSFIILYLSLYGGRKK